MEPRSTTRARRSTKCQPRRASFTSPAGSRRSAPAPFGYRLTPKSCPTHAGRLKVATSRAIPSSSRPNNGMR